MSISVPDTLTVNNSDKYIMSIRLCPDGFSFVAYNPSEAGSFFCREQLFERNTSFTDNFKSSFFENEVFSYPFKRTYIVCASSPYTLVPQKLFDAQEAGRYMRFNFSTPQPKCLWDTVKEAGIAVVFGAEEKLYEFCCRSFPAPRFMHAVSPLLSYWTKAGATTSGNRMYVNLYAKWLDIFCFRQGGLLFANTFGYEHIHDILYYILYIWKEQDLSQLTDRLFISGTPDMRMQLMTVLRKYIRNVAPAEAPSEAYLLGSEAVYAPLDLLIVSSCEL